MAFLRWISGFYALTATTIYIAFASEWTDEVGWGFVGSIIVACLIFIAQSGTAPQKRPQSARAAAPQTVTEIEGEEEETTELDIPEVVTEGPMDGATLRERKLAKIQAAEAKKAEALAAASQSEEDEEELVEVTLEMEDVHTADEFVVEVSPESVEDADIEATVKQRRITHDAVRERIEKRRRGQLAEVHVHNRISIFVFFLVLAKHNARFRCPHGAGCVHPAALHNARGQASTDGPHSTAVGGA